MKKTNHIRNLVSLMLALSVILCALAGCGQSGGSSSGDKGNLKTVRINVSAEPDSLDPWQSAASDTEGIFHNVFQGLCLYDEGGEIIPGLAESWDVSEDGRTYTFHLRQGVVFHNGKKFTSADALYSYNSLTGLDGSEAKSGKFGMIEKLEAPDDFTLAITLKEPSASFLSLTTAAILPEGYPDQATHPVGTGPFAFVEYVPSQRVVLEKNQDYYEKGPNGETIPQIDRVEIYLMTDTAAVVSALRSGQLDVATMLDADDAKVLEGDFDIYRSPQNMPVVLAMNNAQAPFDDIRVRQAVNYALDKNEVIQGAFGGYGTELHSNFSPVMPTYYNDQLDAYYPTDREKAKELLAEAGYGQGLEFSITVPANYQPLIDAAQVIIQQLSQVGITADIQTIEWATWLSDVYGGAQYQSTIIGLSGKLDPDAVLGRFESTYAKNFYKFANEEYDSLITQARVELDEEKRAESYKRCQEILAQEAVAAFLADPDLVVACRKDLKGYTFYPVTFYDFSKLYYQ